MPIFGTEPAEDFAPYSTSTLDKVGLSTSRPVCIGSWIQGDGSFRSMLPWHPDFPGWHYGLPIYMPDVQGRRPHTHEHFEISLIRQGRAMHRTSCSTNELAPGTVLVLGPGTTHAIYGLGGLHQTNLYYIVEWLADDLMGHWRETGLIPLFLAAALFRQPKEGPVVVFQLSEEEMAAVDREFADIAREAYRPMPSLTFLRSSLLKALIILSRSYGRQNAVEVGLGFRTEILSALQRIEAIIYRCEPMSVVQLAEEVGFSAGHLNAAFRDATGWSPMTYYQRRRVQHACNYLLDPDRSVTDIAHALGYCDSAHFTNMFKKYQATTPLEYRQRFTQSHRLTEA